ncbi:hypothetical protein NPX13_g5913 [Xylaria arbuscula]|uniref:NB-ARC domain-containing protein n=1 Tax=Xylaria arbuscula TaxID=114810 RepID=A0A9W8TLY1_9PEZI|nr:hypothetical protein NPX13_g5913 [Xylaria arbuscula]
MVESTAISFGNSNRGLQVGQNSGPIHAAFHLPPGRPETPPKPSFNIPFRRDADFVERKTILDQIYQACLRPASRVALVGLGGVGKSQLAIEYAYRVRDASVQENQEIWVFWIHAETKARVEEGFKSIVNAVKITGRNRPKADIPQLVYEWLQKERNERWLIVLDSADNIDVFYNMQAMARQTASEGEKKPLSAYLPQSSNGSILVTTRNRDLANRLTGRYNDIIDIGPMDQEHALALLARKSKEDADMDMATNLVEVLEYMPLAISQAAAYIQRRAPQTLRDYCLISINKEGDVFEMHGLVQLATRKWLDADGESEKFKGLFISRMAKAFPSGAFENWDTCQKLFPHAEKAVEYRPKEEELQNEWALLLYKSSWYALEQGKYTTSEAMARMSQDMRKMVLGPDHPSTLTSMANLASTYWNQGRWKEAELLEVQVMETSKTVLGPDHPDTLTSMANLAFTWKSQSHSANAVQLMEDCIQIRRRVLGPDHPHTLSSLSTLSNWREESAPSRHNLYTS